MAEINGWNIYPLPSVGPVDTLGSKDLDRRGGTYKVSISVSRHAIAQDKTSKGRVYYMTRVWCHTCLSGDRSLLVEQYTSRQKAERRAFQLAKSINGEKITPAKIKKFRSMKKPAKFSRRMNKWSVVNLVS